METITLSPKVILPFEHYNEGEIKNIQMAESILDIINRISYIPKDMSELDKLGIQFNTDKSSEHHDYCRIYEKYFEPLRDKKITLLELGFGGHEDPAKGGESMNMWEAYFPKAQLACIDIHPKNPELVKVDLYLGSQDDNEFLSDVVAHSGLPTIVIDDCSHLSSLTIKSFETLFPLLKSGGYYCVEDTHSSIHSFYYGKEEANENPRLNGTKTITALNYFKTLTDAVNNDLMKEQYRLPFDVEFVHFFHDLIIIKKL